MQPEQESYAKEFIEGMQQAVRCDWCGRDGWKNRRGLCRHCNDVRKDFERVEKLARDVSEPKSFIQDWEQRVTRQKKKDCMAWGLMLRGILNGSVDPLALEHWFCMVAKHIARDDRMHRGTATTLGWIFTPEQRQVLAYFFWEIFSAEASHKRQSRAQWHAQCESLKAGIDTNGGRADAAKGV
jgi:hypothetical protein